MPGFRQYLAAVASANRLGSDVEWLFYPGMLLDSRLKWWGNFGYRQAAHEGIDICFYRIRTGPVRPLPAGAMVPAWSAGTVINVCDDFMGRSLVVETGVDPSNKTRILEIYAHLSVSDQVAPGTRVQTGQIIARTAIVHATKSVLPPHLHLSCIEAPAAIPGHALNWSFFPGRENINVLPPVFM
jgi:hypothetical protein